jgi:hypothetical protein
MLTTLRDCFLAGALVAFNPYVVYGHVGYSEAIYFALAAAAFVALERRRWILSGMAGALLSVTRIVGCVFALSFLIYAFKHYRVPDISRRSRLLILLGLMLCPLGLAVYMIYLYVHTGDALGFMHILIVWGRVLHNPITVIANALRHHRWERVWGVMILIGLLTSGWLLKEGRPEMAVYLAVAIIIPLCADTWGFARYLWWQPPFLYALFVVLKRHSWVWPIYMAFAGGMASFMVIEWLAGRNGFVI